MFSLGLRPKPAPRPEQARVRPVASLPGAMRLRGFTVVEILIVVVLFGTMAGFAAELYQRSVSVERRLGVKLDLLHHAQIASLQLSRSLREASEIVAPPEGSTQTRPYIIYVDELNQLMVIYVNTKGQLVQMNRSDSDKETVLGSGISRLRAHRKGHRLVNYHLFLEDAASSEKFNLISGVTIRNSIH